LHAVVVLIDEIFALFRRVKLCVAGQFAVSFHLAQARDDAS